MLGSPMSRISQFDKLWHTLICHCCGTCQPVICTKRCFSNLPIVPITSKSCAVWNLLLHHQFSTKLVQLHSMQVAFTPSLSPKCTAVWRAGTQICAQWSHLFRDLSSCSFKFKDKVSLSCWTHSKENIGSSTSMSLCHFLECVLTSK